MTSTMKWVLRILLIAVVLFLAYALVVAYAPSSQGAERRITSVEHHDGVTAKTWVERGVTCLSGGRLRGWVISYRAEMSAWPHEWQYTFGPWSGSFCSTSSRITDVSWGGKPPGSANPFGTWRWHDDDTHIVFSDNAGAVRDRKWRGHATSGISPFIREDFPWLYVFLKAGQAPSIDSGRG